MKKVLLFTIIASILGCGDGQRCPDVISKYNEKIKYKEGDILTFKDSLSNVMYDTVKMVHIDKPDYERYSAAKKDGYEQETRFKDRACEAHTFVEFSNLFYIRIYSNYADGHVEIKGLMGWMAPAGYGFWSWNDYAYVYGVDTIDYTYHNKKYKAYKYSYIYDTLKSAYWELQKDLTNQTEFIYHSYTFIYEDDIKLVEYTTIDKFNKKKRWVLQE